MVCARSWFLGIVLPARSSLAEWARQAVATRVIRDMVSVRIVLPAAG